ncbi:MAG: CBS and ACT domain-containing protein [Bacteroidota bacterium]
MLVQDIMVTEVITVTPATPLAEAYQRMRETRVRHLAVVEGGRLVGVVTDRDLRMATSALHPQPFDPEAQVDAVMARDPMTAAPRDPVEEAAQWMRQRRIGCLPVVDGDALVGIVTNTDLLDAVVRLTGLHKPGGRLLVRLADEPGQLGTLMGSLADKGVNVHAVLSYQAEDDVEASRLRVVLRVGTLRGHLLAESLREEGFDVRWPLKKDRL